MKSPERQFVAFMAKYGPDIRRLAEEALVKMPLLVPGAVEMVYDNYNALVIGFGPTERASEAIFSIVLYPCWVTLFFLRGATLPDPQKLLRGSGQDCPTHRAQRRGRSRCTGRAGADHSRARPRGKAAGSAQSGSDGHQVGVGQATPAAAARYFSKSHATRLVRRPRILFLIDANRS